MQLANKPTTFLSRLTGFCSDLSALILMGMLLLAPTPAVAQDISWNLMPGSMSDIGVGAGLVWGVDSNGNVFRWRAANGTWTPISPKSIVARRVSVDDRGNAWVVNADGDILKWSGSAFVRQARIRDQQNLIRPFSDIGVGANGAAWAVAKFDKRVDPDGVAGSWVSFTGNTWNRGMSGEPKSVSVDPSGNAWTVDVQGYIAKWDGRNAVMASANARAIDVAACHNGDVFIVGTDKAPYKWNGSSWDKKTGANLMNIACDHTGTLYATSTTQQVFVGVKTASSPAAAANQEKALAAAAAAAKEKALADAAAAAKAKALADAAFGAAQAKAQADAAAAAAQAKAKADALTAVTLAEFKAREKANANAADAAALAKDQAAAFAKLKAEAAANPFMGCQQLSDKWGFSDGASIVGPNVLYRQQWIENNCRTKPAQPVATPTVRSCGSGQVNQNGVCVSLAEAQLSINAGNAAICTKNQTAYLANEEIVANNKSKEIQVKIKAAEDEKMSRDYKANIDYAPNPKFDFGAKHAQANQLRLVLANNQQGAQDKIRALTNEQIAWTALHKTKVENWLKDSRYDKSICP